MPTFYFDPTASSSSGAGTEANPYRNQAQLGAMPRGPDTTLLFRRGTVWRPGLVSAPGNSNTTMIPSSVFNHNNVVIGAYGSGAKPVIDGSIDLTGWTAVAGQANTWSVAMPGLTAMHHRAGNLTQGDAVPHFCRWEGSPADSFSAWGGTGPFAQVFDRNNSIWFIKTPNNPNTTPVQASYWRWWLNNSDNTASRSGHRLTDIVFRRFSTNPLIPHALLGMVISRCEGRYIGGIWRPEQSFYEGNWLDIRAGCHDMVIEDCIVEDVFDAGISPQFASSWGTMPTFTTLNNVTIRRNILRRCGLAGVENVIQNDVTDRIDGVFVEYNTFEECGKGPFGRASTWQGDGAAVNCGQNGSGNQTALTTNVHVRYNRIINSQIVNGDYKGPAQIFVYGNICTMAPGFSRPEDIGVRMSWSVSSLLPDIQRHRVFGNVIDGYPTAVAANFANFPIEAFVRYNTIINCPVAFQGNGLSNITARISNNLIHNCTTGAAGWGNSSFASQGGNRLSTVGTVGFTTLGSDQTGQAAPVFQASSYQPPSASVLLSGGVTGFAEYGDPNGVLFTTNQASRNAYASAVVGTGPGAGAAPTTPGAPPAVLPSLPVQPNVFPRLTSTLQTVGLRAWSVDGSGNPNAAPVWVVAPPTLTVTAGATVSASRTANATPAPTYSIVSGPAWLTINSATGALGGTAPAAAGSFSAVLRATNSVGATDLALTIAVVTVPVITTLTLPAAITGQTYTVLLVAEGTGPFTWSLPAGTLPTGLSLVGSTITGTATGATQTFTVRVDGAAGFATQVLTLTVNAPNAAPVITTVGLADAIANAAGTRALSATGAATIVWSVPFSAAAGVSINASSGVLSYPALAAGTYSITVQATNSVGSVQRTFVLQVSAVDADPIARRTWVGPDGGGAAWKRSR